MQSTRARLTAKYDRGNLEAAEIILADVERFGGEAGGAVQWARAFMSRFERQRQVARSLFSGEEAGE